MEEFSKLLIEVLKMSVDSKKSAVGDMFYCCLLLLWWLQCGGCFLQVDVKMQAKTSTNSADKAINKFGWAAIILAVGLSIAAVIAAAGIAGIFSLMAK